MAYDEGLAEQIRNVLPRLALRPGEELGEMRMFGGICFAINRKMLVGVDQSRVMVRIGTEELDEAIRAGLATPMDFTGKPLRNFAFLTEAAYSTDEDLLRWIEGSARFVRENMLGEKPAGKKRLPRPKN